MANEKNDLAKQKISGLFELAKLHRAQKDITSKTDTIEDKLQKKLDHLKLTGEMEEKVPPIVVGNTGIILDGNSISKTTYLDSLKVDDSLYGDLILTEEQASRINYKMNKFTSGVNSVIPMLCTGNRCAFKATCLAGDTLVLMFDGTFKKIKDIKRGDRIVSFNKGTRKLELDMAKTNSEMKGLKPVYRLTTEFGHELILTDDHPVYSSEMGIHPFDYACIKTGLAEGDTVLVSDAFPNDCLEVSIEEVEEYGDTFVAEITSIELIGEEEVYDFPVYGNKNFVASGVVVHNCQPGYSQVLTTNGYKDMSELKPGVDKIISVSNLSRGHKGVYKDGRDFTLHKRHFKGKMYEFSTGGRSYLCTPDQICEITFNENAIGKHLVYLMKSGNKFRVGVTTLIQEVRKEKGQQFGLTVRVRMEKADCAWILAVHDTRVEALLDEEYYSIKWNAPKSLFISDDASRHSTRWNGKNQWVSQDQLNTQFARINESEDFYAERLSEIGLDIRYPFYSRNEYGDNYASKSFGTKTKSKVRAMNILPDYMNMVEYDERDSALEMAASHRARSISLNMVDYDDYVYSLDVDVDHNYIVNGILTANCPYYQEDKAPLGLPCLVESNLLYFYTSQYMEEFDVDQSRFTELHLIGELAEFDIYEMRATKLIAEKYPTMISDVVMGFDSDGNAIINEDISKVFELKERLKKSRMKILETLMATRKERAKAIIASNANEQIGVTSLRSKLDMLLKEVKDHGGQNKGSKSRNDDVIDAEFVE